MGTAAEDRAREQARVVTELVERWRSTASAAPPWEVRQVEGTYVLWDTRDDRLLGVLSGQWAPNVAAYLEAMNPYAGTALAELLWSLRHNTVTNSRLRRLFQLMRLDERPVRSRRR